VLGIENATGTLGVMAPGRSPGTWNVTVPEAWRFSPAPLTYAWTPVTFLNNPSIANPVASGVTATTTYTVTATALNSCTATASATVTVDPAPFTVTGGGAYCSGGSGVPVGLNGSQTGVNYQLFLGANPVGLPMAGSGMALAFGNQTAAGTYTVVATNTSTSCTGTMTGSAVVAINPLPTFTSSTTNPTDCQATNGVISITPVIGMAPFGFSWSTPNGCGISAGAQNQTALCAGTYNLTISDANGCSTTGVFSLLPNCFNCPVLTANAPPAVVVNSTCSTFGGSPSGGLISAPATPCPVGSTVEYSTNGPAGPWSTSPPSYAQSGPAQTILTRCTCDGNPALFSPSGTVTTTPGTCPPCPVLTVAPAQVTVFNSACTTACVVQGGSIVAPGGNPCPVGSTLQYRVTVNAIPGAWTSVLPTYAQTGPAQSIETRCSCINDPLTVSPSLAAVTTVPGVCTPPVVMITITAENSGVASNDGITCAGGSVTLNASGGGTYAWSVGGLTTSSITVAPLSTTPYTVTVTNANGCSTIVSRTITVNPLPTAFTVTGGGTY
jgi:hypothetical protein